MPATAQTGGLATTGGFWTLAGPSVITLPVARTMPAQATPYIAHVFDYKWTPIGELKVSGVVTNSPLDRQPFKSSINAGLHPLTLTLEGPTTLSSGSIIALSEQDGDGQYVFGGILEKIVDSIGATTVHQLVVTPFVAELGDAHFTGIYATPTDVGQMVRDAVAGCLHVSANWVTCPNTGVLMIATFNDTTVLDTIHQCRQMAGQNYWWHVDEIGRLFFQPTGSAAVYTVTQNDYKEREKTQDDTTRKNQVEVKGGVGLIGTQGNQVTGQMSSTYDGTSESTMGVRRWDPPPTYPGITDQRTLDTIANSLGKMFDRTITTVKLRLPAYAPRVQIGQVGGPILRYWEPATFPMAESEAGSGSYSSNFVVLDVETDGVEQLVTIGDLPYSAQDDYQYEVVRVLQRVALAPGIYTPDSLNTATVMSPGASTSTSQTGARTSFDTYGISVYDGSLAVPRVKAGNLPAYTDPNGVASPAEFGIRALDANGNIIFDPVGLAQVMNLIASAYALGGSTVTGPATEVAVGNLANFTLARQQHVLTFYAFVTGVTSTGAYVYANAQVDGADGGAGAANHHFGVYNSGGYLNAFFLRLDLLGAGSHTAGITVDVDSGATAAPFHVGVFCFGVGG